MIYLKQQDAIEELNHEKAQMRELEDVGEKTVDPEEKKVIEIETKQIEKSEEVESEEKSTMFQAGLNLFKSYIGGGILGLPYAFERAGYLLATILMLIIILVMYYTTTLIIELCSTMDKPNLTFKDVFDATLGKRGTNIYKILLVIMQMGCCVAYVIFFTEFFSIAFGVSNTAGNRIIFLALSLIVIVPMIMINTYHLFHKWSRWANIFTLITLLTVLEFAITKLMNKSHNNEEIKEDLFHFSDIPHFLGIGIFAFECIGSIFAVRASMKEPKEFQLLFFRVTLFVGILYISFAVICCLAIGRGVKQIVLLGLQNDKSYLWFAQVLYSLALMITYPIQFYPVIYVIENNRWLKQHLEINPNSKCIRYLPRFILTLIIFLLAFAIPKFATFLNLVGAISGIGMQFIFPIFAYHCKFHSISKKQKSLNYLILLFGIVGGIMSIAYSLTEIFYD